MQLWEKYSVNSSKKIGGRACYNLALGYEVTGDLQSAHTWAQKAYVDFGLRKAKEYDDLLQYRINSLNNQ